VLFSALNIILAINLYRTFKTNLEYIIKDLNTLKSYRGSLIAGLSKL